MALFNRKELIRLETPDPVDVAAGPPNFQDLDYFSLPNAKVQAQVILGVVASTAAHFSHQSQLACDAGDPGSDCAAIGPLPHKLDLQPVTQIPTVVSKKFRNGVHWVDDDVHIAIVVNVAERCSARRNSPLDRLARQPRDVAESSVAEILIEHFWLPIAEARLQAVDLRVHMSVDIENI